MVYGVLDDVFMVEFLQNSDLSQGCRWNPLILGIHSDYLDRHDLLGPCDAALVDTAVGTLTKFDQKVDLFGYLHWIQELITKIGSQPTTSSCASID